VNHTIDAIHLSVVFEKVDDGIPNIEKKKQRIGLKSMHLPTEIQDLFHFISFLSCEILQRQIANNSCI
jgi:hypothetical protein